MFHPKRIIFISVFEGAEYVIKIAPGAYEIESLNEEIERIFIEEDYPFAIKPNFSSR